MTKPWWKKSVVYQIYPRSFYDSNGDGIGDLRGVIAKLDYLALLGVDVVWLSPIYKSPNDDNGYDISDYCDIMQEFGTLADFDAMLAAMHERGIKLVMDLVVNHSSDEHFWFQQARSSRDNAYHDYYIWREAKPDGSPPNNWEAAFKGSVWEYNPPTGEYYLHMFSKKQPDLNWENPKVRQEVHALMRFWLDRGVDGFRMDVINMISKPWQADGSLPDAPIVRAGLLQPSFSMVTNGPRLLEFLREMKREVLCHYDTITVGETPLATTTQGMEITGEADGVLNMLFQFEHMDVDCAADADGGKWAARPLDLRRFKRVMSHWQDDLAGRGWNSLYLCNHDQPRPVSRFGDDGTYRVQSAKMLATCLHLLQGTPYVYQGEELAMTNVKFTSIDDYRDIEIRNYYREEVIEKGCDPTQVMAAIHARGRDNARTPMQWSVEDNAGFSSTTPWIKVNPNYPAINAEQAVNDPDSVFHYYRRLIALRKTHPVVVEGDYRMLLADHPAIYAYTRTLADECLLVLCNFSREQQSVALPPDLPLTGASLLISNYPAPTDEEALASCLRAWEARVYRMNT